MQLDTDLTPEKIRWIVQGMVILLLSISVHEFGHAYAADRLGDRLPRRQGRVTLNPIAHADLIGTIILPLIGLVTASRVGFGWGKPVEHTTHDRKRRVYISFAGPAMNVVLATVVATLHVALVATHVLQPGSPLNQSLIYAVSLNFLLFFFNLLPAAPLDGDSVARGLIPARWVPAWDRYAVYGLFVVMAFVMVSPLGQLFRVPAHFCTEQLYRGLALLFGLQ